MTDRDGSLRGGNKGQARCQICRAAPSTPKDVHIYCVDFVLVGNREAWTFSGLLEALAEREEEGKQVGQELQEAEQAGSLPNSAKANNFLSLAYPSHTHHLAQICPCPGVVPFDTPVLQ